MPRKKDIRPLAVDEPTIGDMQQARPRSQMTGNLAQLLHVPLVFNT